MTALAKLFGTADGENLSRRDLLRGGWRTALGLGAVAATASFLPADEAEAQQLISATNNPPMSFLEAKDYSESHHAILIHYGGDDRNKFYAETTAAALRKANLKAFAVPGGPDNGAILFVYGKYPEKIYTSAELGGGMISDHALAFHKQLSGTVSEGPVRDVAS